MDKITGKKGRRMGVAVLAAAVLFGFGMKVGSAAAATNEPGSAGDPLITRSYLEAELESIGNGYECITLKKGESLSLTQGSQMILYTGTAIVSGSLIDVTDGTLASAGSRAQKYHSYLTPADGSGFTAEATCVIFLSE